MQRKKVVCIRNWMDCGIVSLGHLVGPHGYLSYNEFKRQNFPMLGLIFFDKILRTTREKCLIWFQYKLLYNLLPTGRFLFQRQLVDSPVCVFCKGAEETLLHMFWDCPKIQDYWFDVQGWLHTSFTHCTDIIFSKKLVILVSKANMVTDRILD